MQDGTGRLAARREPALLNPPSDPNLRSLADSAIRAVHTLQSDDDPGPLQALLRRLAPAHQVRFDPKEMG